MPSMPRTRDIQPTFHTPAGDKFTIGTIDGKPLEITAQYNPKELAFQSTASWNQHVSNNGGQGNRGQNVYLVLDYSNTESRTLTAELVFDGYEAGISIQPFVDALESLTIPQEPTSSQPEDRRPQLCVAIWGVAPAFRCVVQAVATKLVMFGRDGTPLRAVCTVTLREVDALAMLGAHENTIDARVNKTRSWSRRAELE